MINNLSVLAIIPARAGSKGIIDKNIRLIKNKPLIAYTIEAAKKSKYIDDTIVSTDGEKIAHIANKFAGGEEIVPFLRPENLAQDNSKTIDAICYTLERLKTEFKREYDIIVLLQPTSPLRNKYHIDEAIETFVNNDMNKGLVSVNEVAKSPILMRELKNDELVSIISMNSTIRRQDMPKYYVVNGAIYINLTKDINKDLSLNDNKIPYFMENNLSLDIDTIEDLKKAEEYMEGYNL